MSKKILIAISALLTAGCFFGGESDAPTSITADTKDTDTAKVKLIKPGIYAGDYAWIDSNKAGLESEFILDSNGSFRLFWISENEAVYDQRGNWHQKDSNFFFNGATETWAQGGIFDNFTAIEDDTNAIVGVTDSSFRRREWTPLRQKPYWITYSRKTYPTLREGTYTLKRTYGSDSDAVDYMFTIKLKDKGFFFSVLQDDTLESFQDSATYYQIGSFLATDGNKQREPDSTNTFPDWSPVQGTVLKRLQTVSDTAFSMWSPASFFEPGSWDPYSKIVANQVGP